MYDFISQIIITFKEGSDKPPHPLVWSGNLLVEFRLTIQLTVTEDLTELHVVDFRYIH